MGQRFDHVDAGQHRVAGALAGQREDGSLDRLGVLVLRKGDVQVGEWAQCVDPGDVVRASVLLDDSAKVEQVSQKYRTFFDGHKFLFCGLRRGIRAGIEICQPYAF